VVAVMVLWAANFIVVKDALSTLPPVGFTMLRYALASIALLVILRWSDGVVRLPRPDTLRILVLGGFGFGLYQILWTTGLTSIPAGDSALIIASTPVLVAVLAVIAGADTLTPMKFVGAALSFLGVVVVIAAGVGISMSGSVVGSLLTLAAAACWATYTAFAAPVLRRHSPLVLTTWATIGGTIVLIPPGLAQLLAPGALGPPRSCRSCWRSRIPGSSPQPWRMSSSSTASASSARRASSRSSRSCRPWRSCWRSCFWLSRSGRHRWSAG
jgi:drug/metabolite transporter (DMT)-like permease